MRFSAGTRTSVKNTSLNNASPVISRIGRTSMPGQIHRDDEVRDAAVLGDVVAGARDEDAELGVRGERRPDLLPVDEVHVAVAFGAGADRFARSEPAPGSLNSWHQSSSPRSIGAR